VHKLNQNALLSTYYRGTQTNASDSICTVSLFFLAQRKTLYMTKAAFPLVQLRMQCDTCVSCKVTHVTGRYVRVFICLFPAAGACFRLIV
jgi:hypothetical protein